MQTKNKKQFGVWMDNRHAVIVGRENVDEGKWVVLGRTVQAEHEGNTNEHTYNNAEKGLLMKLFKEVTSFMQNVDEVHVTGPGTAQEQFIKYLADTPQYKKAVATESAATRMGDDELVAYIAGRFTKSKQEA